MSGYAWLGVITSAAVSALAVGAYIVMALPYFDNMPYLAELRRSASKAAAIGALIFGFFFAIFYLAARHLNQDTSGPLLLFAALVIALPMSLLLGTETWDRHNGHGMSKVPGPRAVAVATGIGLLEISMLTLAFVVVL